MRKVLTHCTRKADLLTFRYISAQREEPINRLFSARGLPTRDWGGVIIIPRTCACIAIYACNVLKPCLHCTHNQSGSYPDWLDPDRIWIRSVHTAIFILLKHVVTLVLLSKVFLHERGGSHSPVSIALLPHTRNQRFHETESSLP